jgi:hypothetical protein
MWGGGGGLEIMRARRRREGQATALKAHLRRIGRGPLRDLLRVLQ